MRIPTKAEFLTVQSKADAELFEQAFPEWSKLPATDPRKAQIIEAIKHEEIILTYLAGVFFVGVIVVGLFILFWKFL